MTHLQECKARLANLKLNLAMERDHLSKYAVDLRLTISHVESVIRQLEFGRDNPILMVP